MSLVFFISFPFPVMASVQQSFTERMKMISVHLRCSDGEAEVEGKEERKDRGFVSSQQRCQCTPYDVSSLNI